MQDGISITLDDNNKPKVTKYDAIGLLNDGIDLGDFSKSLGPREFLSLYPKEHYLQQNPELAENPNFDKMYSQVAQTIPQINDTKWMNRQKTTAEKNAFPGTDISWYTQPVNLKSSPFTLSGDMWASPQEFAYATGKYVERDPMSGEDMIKEMSFWDKNGRLLVGAITGGGAPILTAGLVDSSIVDGKTLAYDTDQYGNTIIRKYNSIDDLDDKQMVNMWGPQKAWGNDWYQGVAGFLTEFTAKFFRSGLTMLKSMSDLTVGVLSKSLYEDQEERQQFVNTVRDNDVVKFVDSALNRGINNYTAMTYTPSLEIEKQGWFGSWNSLGYNLSTGIGQLAAQIAFSYVTGGAGSWASLIGRYGMQTATKAAGQSAFRTVLKKGLSKVMSTANNRFAGAGTIVAMDDFYRSARASGLSREDAGQLTAVATPMVFITERMLSAPYFSKILEGGDAYVRKARNEVFQKSIKKVIESGVKINSKEGAVAVAKETEEGLKKTVLKSFGEAVSKKIAPIKKSLTKDNLAKVGESLPARILQGGAREGIQEGLEETGYIGIEHVWDHWIADDKIMATPLFSEQGVGQGKFGTNFGSEESFNRIAENFTAGFMLGLTGVVGGRLGQAMIRKKMKGKPGWIDIKKYPLQAAILKGQEDEILNPLYKQYDNGDLGRQDLNAMQSPIMMGTEDEQPSITIEHDRYEKWGLEKGKKISNHNDLAWYNTLEYVYGEKAKLHTIYNAIRNEIRDIDHFNELMDSPTAVSRLIDAYESMADDRVLYEKNAADYEEHEATHGEDKAMKESLATQRKELVEKQQAFDDEFVKSSNKAELDILNAKIAGLNKNKEDGNTSPEIDVQIEVAQKQIEDLQGDTSIRSTHNRNFIKTFGTGLLNGLSYNANKDGKIYSIEEFSQLENNILNDGSKAKTRAIELLRQEKQALEQESGQLVTGLQETVQALEQYVGIKPGEDGKYSPKEQATKDELRKTLGESIQKLWNIRKLSKVSKQKYPAEVIDLLEKLNISVDGIVESEGYNSEMIDELDKFAGANPNEEISKFHTQINKSFTEFYQEDKEEEEKNFEDRMVDALFEEIDSMLESLPNLETGTISKELHLPIIKQIRNILLGNVDETTGDNVGLGLVEMLGKIGLFKQLNDKSGYNGISAVKSDTDVARSQNTGTYPIDGRAYSNEFVAKAIMRLMEVKSLVSQYSEKAGLGFEQRFEKSVRATITILINKYNLLKRQFGVDMDLLPAEIKQVAYTYQAEFAKFIAKDNIDNMLKQPKAWVNIHTELIRHELNMMNFEKLVYDHVMSLDGELREGEKITERERFRLRMYYSMMDSIKDSVPADERNYLMEYFLKNADNNIKFNIFQKKDIDGWLKLIEKGNMTEELYNFLLMNGIKNPGIVGEKINSSLLRSIINNLRDFTVNYINNITLQDPTLTYKVLMDASNALYQDTEGQLGPRPDVWQEEAIKTIISYINQDENNTFVASEYAGITESGTIHKNHGGHTAVIAIQGYAGTGKSQMVTARIIDFIDVIERYRAEQEGEGYVKKTLHLITPSTELVNDIIKKPFDQYGFKIEITEYNDFLASIEENPNHLSKLIYATDYLIIDEASRLTADETKAIKDSTYYSKDGKKRAKIFLPGDNYQSPVGETRGDQRSVMPAVDFIRTIELFDVYRTNVEEIHKVGDAIRNALVGMNVYNIDFPETWYNEDHTMGVLYTDAVKQWLEDIEKRGLDGRHLIFATSLEAERFSETNKLSPEQAAYVRYLVPSEQHKFKKGLFNTTSVQGLSVPYAYVAITAGSSTGERKDFYTAIGRSKKFCCITGGPSELSKLDETGTKIIDYSNPENKDLFALKNSIDQEYGMFAKQRLDALGNNSDAGINSYLEDFYKRNAEKTPESGPEKNSTSFNESTEVFEIRKKITQARADKNIPAIANGYLDVTEGIEPGEENGVTVYKKKSDSKMVFARMTSAVDMFFKSIMSEKAYNDFKSKQDPKQKNDATAYGNAFDNVATHALLVIYESWAQKNNDPVLNRIIDHMRTSRPDLFDNTGKLRKTSDIKNEFLSTEFVYHTINEKGENYGKKLKTKPSKKTYQDLINHIIALSKSYSYIIPQMIVYDEANKIAGTIDFLAIDENGNTAIIDLKTKSNANKLGMARSTKIGTPPYLNEINIETIDDEYKVEVQTNNGAKKWNKYYMNDIVQQIGYNKMLSNFGSDLSNTPISLDIFIPYKWVNGKSVKDSDNNVVGEWYGYSNIKYQSEVADKIFAIDTVRTNTTTDQPDTGIDNERGPFSTNGKTLDLTIGDIVSNGMGGSWRYKGMENGEVVLEDLNTEEDSELRGLPGNFAVNMYVDVHAKLLDRVRSADNFNSHGVLPMTIISHADDFNFGQDTAVTAKKFWANFDRSNYRQRRDDALRVAKNLTVSYEDVNLWIEDLDPAGKSLGTYTLKLVKAAVIKDENNKRVGALAMPKGIKSSKDIKTNDFQKIYTAKDFSEYSQLEQMQLQANLNNKLAQVHLDLLSNPGKKYNIKVSPLEVVARVQYDKFDSTGVSLREFVNSVMFKDYKLLNLKGDKVNNFSEAAVHFRSDPTPFYYVKAQNSAGQIIHVDLAYKGIEGEQANEYVKKMREDLNAFQNSVKDLVITKEDLANKIAMSDWYQFLKQNISLLSTKNVDGERVLNNIYSKFLTITKYGADGFNLNSATWSQAKTIEKLLGYAQAMDAVVNALKGRKAITIYPAISYNRTFDQDAKLMTRAMYIAGGSIYIDIQAEKKDTEEDYSSSEKGNAATDITAVDDSSPFLMVPSAELLGDNVVLNKDPEPYLYTVMGLAYNPDNWFFDKRMIDDVYTVLGYFKKGLYLYGVNGQKISANYAERHEVIHWMFSILDERSRREAIDEAKRHMVANHLDKQEQFMNVNYKNGIHGISDLEAMEYVADINRGKYFFNDKVQGGGNWLNRFISWFKGLFGIDDLRTNLRTLLDDLNRGKFADMSPVKDSGETTDEIEYLAEVIDPSGLRFDDIEPQTRTKLEKVLNGGFNLSFAIKYLYTQFIAHPKYDRDLSVVSPEMAKKKDKDVWDDVYAEILKFKADPQHVVRPGEDKLSSYSLDAYQANKISGVMNDKMIIPKARTFVLMQLQDKKTFDEVKKICMPNFDFTEDNYNVEIRKMIETGQMNTDMALSKLGKMYISYTPNLSWIKTAKGYAIKSTGNNTNAEQELVSNNVSRIDYKEFENDLLGLVSEYYNSDHFYRSEDKTQGFFDFIAYRVDSITKDSTTTDDVLAPYPSRLLSFIYLFNPASGNMALGDKNFLYEKNGEFSTIDITGRKEWKAQGLGQMTNLRSLITVLGKIHGVKVTDEDITNYFSGKKSSMDNSVYDLLDYAYHKSMNAVKVMNAVMVHLLSNTQKNYSSIEKRFYQDNEGGVDAYYSEKVSAQSDLGAVRDKWIGAITSKLKDIYILDGSTAESREFQESSVDEVFQFPYNNNLKFKMSGDTMSFSYDGTVILTGTPVQKNYKGKISDYQFSFSIPYADINKVSKGLSALMHNIGFPSPDIDVKSVKHILETKPTSDTAIQSRSDYALDSFSRRELAHTLGMMYASLAVRKSGISNNIKNKYSQAIDKYLGSRPIDTDNDLYRLRDELNAEAAQTEESAKKNEIFSKVEDVQKLIDNLTLAKPTYFYYEMEKMAKQVREFSGKRWRNMIPSNDGTTYHRYGFTSYIDRMFAVNEKGDQASNTIINKVIETLLLPQNRLSPMQPSQLLKLHEEQQMDINPAAKFPVPYSNNLIVNRNIAIRSTKWHMGRSFRKSGHNADHESQRELMTDFLFGYFKNSLLGSYLQLTTNVFGEQKFSRVWSVDFGDMYNVTRIGKKITNLTIDEDKLSNLVFTDAVNFVNRGLTSLSKLTALAMQTDPMSFFNILSQKATGIFGALAMPMLEEYNFGTDIAQNLEQLNNIFLNGEKFGIINLLQESLNDYFNQVYFLLKSAETYPGEAKNAMKAFMTSSKIGESYSGLSSTYDFNVTGDEFSLGNASGFQDKIYSLYRDIEINDSPLQRFIASFLTGDMESAKAERDNLYKPLFTNLAFNLKKRKVFIPKEIIKLLNGAEGRQLKVTTQQDDGSYVTEWNPFIKLYLYSKNLFSNSFSELSFGPVLQFLNMAMMSARSRQAGSVGQFAVTSVKSVNPLILPQKMRNIKNFDVTRLGMKTSPEDSQTIFNPILLPFLINSFGGESAAANILATAFKTRFVGADLSVGLGTDTKHMQYMYSADSIFNQQSGLQMLELMLNGQSGSMALSFSEDPTQDQAVLNQMAEWDIYGNFMSNLTKHSENKYYEKLGELFVRINQLNSEYTQQRDEIENKHKINLGEDQDILNRDDEQTKGLRRIIRAMNAQEDKINRLQQNKDAELQAIMFTSHNDVFIPAVLDTSKYIIMLRMQDNPIDPLEVMVSNIIPNTASKTNDSYSNNYNFYKADTFETGGSVLTVNYDNNDIVNILNPNIDKDKIRKPSQMDHVHSSGNEGNLRRGGEINARRNNIAKKMFEELVTNAIAKESKKGITDERKQMIAYFADMVVENAESIPGGELLSRGLSEGRMAYSDPVAQKRIFSEMIKAYDEMVLQKSDGYALSQKPNFTEYYDVPITDQLADGTSYSYIMTISMAELQTGIMDEFFAEKGITVADILSGESRLSETMRFYDSAGVDVASLDNPDFSTVETIVAAEDKLPYRIFEAFDRSESMTYNLAAQNKLPGGKLIRPSTLLEMLTIVVNNEDGSVSYLNAREFVRNNNGSESYYLDRSVGIQKLKEYLRNINPQAQRKDNWGFDEQAIKFIVDDYIEPLLDSLIYVNLRAPYTDFASGKLAEVIEFDFSSKYEVSISSKQIDRDGSDFDADKLANFINVMTLNKFRKTGPEGQVMQPVSGGFMNKGRYRIPTDAEMYIREQQDELRKLYIQGYIDKDNIGAIVRPVGAESIYKMNEPERVKRQKYEFNDLPTEVALKTRAHQDEQMIGAMINFSKRHNMIMQLPSEIRDIFIKIAIADDNKSRRGTMEWIEAHPELVEGESEYDLIARLSPETITALQGIFSNLFFDGTKQPDSQYLNVNLGNLFIADAMMVDGNTAVDIKKMFNSPVVTKIINEVDSSYELGNKRKAYYAVTKAIVNNYNRLTEPGNLKTIRVLRLEKYQYLYDLYTDMRDKKSITFDHTASRFSSKVFSNITLDEIDDVFVDDALANDDFDENTLWSWSFSKMIDEKIAYYERYLTDIDYRNEQDAVKDAKVIATKNQVSEFLTYVLHGEAWQKIGRAVTFDQYQDTRADKIIPKLQELSYDMGVELDQMIYPIDENGVLEGYVAPTAEEATWRKKAIEYNDEGGDEGFYTSDQDTVDFFVSGVLSGINDASKGAISIDRIIIDGDSGISEGAARFGFDNSVPITLFESKKSSYRDNYGNAVRGNDFKNRKFYEDIVDKMAPGGTEIVSVDISNVESDEGAAETIYSNISNLFGPNDFLLVFNHSASTDNLRYHKGDFSNVVHVNLNNRAFSRDGQPNIDAIQNYVAAQMVALIKEKTKGATLENIKTKIYVAGSSMYDFSNKKPNERENFIALEEETRKLIDPVGVLNNLPMIRNNVGMLLNFVNNYGPLLYPIWSPKMKPIIERTLAKIGIASMGRSYIFSAIKRAMDGAAFSFALKELPDMKNVIMRFNSTDYSFDLSDYNQHHPFMLVFSKYIEAVKTNPQYIANPFFATLRIEDGFIVSDVEDQSDNMRKIITNAFENMATNVNDKGEIENIKTMFEAYNIIRFGFDYMKGTITDYVFSIHEKIKSIIDNIANHYDPQSNYHWDELDDFMEKHFENNAIMTFMTDMIPYGRNAFSQFNEDTESNETVYFGKDTEYVKESEFVQDGIGRDRKRLKYMKYTDGIYHEVNGVGHGAMKTMPLFNGVVDYRALFLSTPEEYYRMMKAIETNRSFVYHANQPTTFDVGNEVNVYGNIFEVESTSNFKRTVSLKYKNKLC